MKEESSVGPCNFHYKQVIVIRTDLKMSRGKIVAQAGHAAVCATEEARKKFSVWWKDWIAEGQCKIAVKAKSEQDLLDLEEEAKKSNLPAVLIIDRGLTELEPGTLTCLGIGPAPTIEIDAITRKLPLF